VIARHRIVSLLGLVGLGAVVFTALPAAAANPTVSLGTAVIGVTEGNSGTTNATFTATLSTASSSTVTVGYSTVDGTAKVADSDYNATSGTLTFNPGTTTASATAQVRGDTKLENYETFTVKLSGATNATIKTATERIEIRNDEKPKLTMANVKVSEGQSALFKPRLLQAYYQPITLSASTSNGTAIAPADYTAVSNRAVTFAAGVKTTAPVDVATIADGITEPNETFNLAVTGSGVVAGITRAATITAQLCQGSTPPAHYQHVVLVVMENKHYTDVIGNASAPWMTNLVKSCASAKAYAAAASPSRPNYVAMTAGDIFNCAGSDADPSAGSCTPTSGSVYKQVIDAGGTTLAYAEGMNANCEATSHNRYAVKHNPWPYFASESSLCQQFDKPLPASIDVNNLPTLLTVFPDLCHDMHDCSVAIGDTWLSQYVQPVLNSAAYQNGSTAVIVTWDEYTNLPNVFASQSVTPGTSVTAATSHYALLRTIEDMLGLGPLGQAATATGLRAATHL
jgi:hypothetical protein